MTLTNKLMRTADFPTQKLNTSAPSYPLVSCLYSVSGRQTAVYTNRNCGLPTNITTDRQGYRYYLCPNSSNKLSYRLWSIAYCLSSIVYGPSSIVHPN
ncbi:MAG: hypothetical protein M9887_10590 [Chitinophagales bacterium]|nr:hypothetical protein [Chitinophagales bacterium]